MPYLSFAQSHRRHELMSKLCFFFLDSQSIEYFKVEKHFLLCNIACWSKLMDNSTNFRHFWYQWNHSTYRTHRTNFLYKWNFLFRLVCFRLRFFFIFFSEIVRTNQMSILNFIVARYIIVLFSPKSITSKENICTYQFTDISVTYKCKQRILLFDESLIIFLNNKIIKNFFFVKIESFTWIWHRDPFREDGLYFQLECFLVVS